MRIQPTVNVDCYAPAAPSLSVKLVGSLSLDRGRPLRAG